MNRISKEIVVDIIDDHRMVINGLRDMLASLPGIRTGNIYENGLDLLKGFGKELPDILLLDIQMPDIRGDELASLVLRSYPAVNIIVVTGYNTTDYAWLMLDTGVMGYLLKNTDEYKLRLAIETVHKGKTYIEPAIREMLDKEQREQSSALSGLHAPLTRREKDILRLIIDEMTSQEIASRLNLSLRTVENHRVSLMQKLDAKNVAGIVKKAFQLGLVK